MPKRSLWYAALGLVIVLLVAFAMRWTILDKAAEALFLPTESTKPQQHSVRTQRIAEMTVADGTVLRA